VIKEIREGVATLRSRKSSLEDKLHAGMIMFFTSAIAVSVLSLSFFLVDQTNLTPHKTIVVVETKEFIPVNVRFIIGKMKIVERNVHPFTIQFEIDDKKITQWIEESFFKNLQVGDYIEVTYEVGRISNIYSPTSVRPVDRLSKSSILINPGSEEIQHVKPKNEIDIVPEERQDDEGETYFEDTPEDEWDDEEMEDSTFA